MPRFLCLPGYLQSGRVFAEKSSGLRKMLTKKLGYELEYIDPPILIHKKELLPFQLGTDETESEQRWNDLVSKNVNRCWWDYHDGIYEHFQEAYDYLVDYIRKNGPYDGILGFSQGAAMAAIMANTIASHEGLAEFKVAVLFSGFAFTISSRDAKTDEELVDDFAARLSLNKLYEKYYKRGKLDTTFVSIYGKEDAVVPPARSQYLNRLYGNAVNVFTHDGGHFVPNKKDVLQPIVDVIWGAIELKPFL